MFQLSGVRCKSSKFQGLRIFDAHTRTRQARLHIVKGVGIKGFRVYGSRVSGFMQDWDFSLGVVAASGVSSSLSIELTSISAGS